MTPPATAGEELIGLVPSDLLQFTAPVCAFNSTTEPESRPTTTEPASTAGDESIGPPPRTFVLQTFMPVLTSIASTTPFWLAVYAIAWATAGAVVRAALVV